MNRLHWPLRVLAFVVWYVVQVVLANALVLRDNLTPGQDSAPGIARCTTRCRTDFEITLLGTLITLTPGTLTMGTRVLADGVRVLYVHGMYNEGPDDLRAEIHEMETRMLAAVRLEGAPR